MPYSDSKLPDGASIQTTTNLTPTSEERVRAVYTGQLNPAVQHMYSIALVDASTPDVSIIEAQGLDPAGRTTVAEYYFTVPPKTYEIGEPYATTVLATQAGGKLVETHGSLLKDITVAGTTGLRPNPTKGPFNEIPLFGSAANKLNEIGNNLVFAQGLKDITSSSKLPVNEATGFDDIIFLQNIFRHYSDIKESGARSSNIFMIWRNAKDADYWIVEPTEFKLSRDAGSPLTYKYSIRLKTLSKFTTSLSIPADPMDKILSTQRFFSRIQEYNRDLKQGFLIIATQISRLEGFGVFAQTQLLSPIINTVRGLGVIKNTTTKFGDKIRYNAAVLLNNLTDARYQLTGSPTVNGVQLVPSPGFDYELQDALVRTLRKLEWVACSILTEPSFKTNVGSNVHDDAGRYSGAYNSSGGSFNNTRKLPATGGASSFLGNNQFTNSVGQSLVHTGEDIRSIAGRLLKDKMKWQMLVVMNNLTAPFIAPTSSPGVLAPGDTILYPLPTSSGLDANFTGRTDTSDQETDGTDQGQLGPAQQAYGRDLKLRSVESVGGVDLTDLAVNQSGDIASVVGLPNVDQALRLKFLTERGELAAHPVYGSKFPIGSKATTVAFNEYRIHTESTFYSDKRIQKVRQLRFETSGDVLFVNAEVQLINGSDALSTKIALRRF